MFFREFWNQAGVTNLNQLIKQLQAITERAFIYLLNLYSEQKQTSFMAMRSCMILAFEPRTGHAIKIQKKKLLSS